MRKHDFLGRPVGLGRRILLGFEFCHTLAGTGVLGAMTLGGLAGVLWTIYSLLFRGATAKNSLGLLVCSGAALIVGFIALRGMRRQNGLLRQAILSDTAAIDQLQSEWQRQSRAVLRINGPLMVGLCVVALVVVLRVGVIPVWYRILFAALAVVGGCVSCRATIRAWRG